MTHTRRQSYLVGDALFFRSNIETSGMSTRVSCRVVRIHAVSMSEKVHLGEIRTTPHKHNGRLLKSNPLVDVVRTISPNW